MLQQLYVSAEEDKEMSPWRGMSNWLKVTETVIAEAGIKWRLAFSERREGRLRSLAEAAQSDYGLGGATLEGATQKPYCQ